MDEKSIAANLRAANTFFFGLLPSHQTRAFQWLANEVGYLDAHGHQLRGSYTSALEEIFCTHSIQDIIQDILLPRVEADFGQPITKDGRSALDFLRPYWLQGEPPTRAEMEAYEPSLKCHTPIRGVEKDLDYGLGSCALLDITLVGGKKEDPATKWVIHFSEFTKFYFTFLDDLDSEASFDYDANPDRDMDLGLNASTRQLRSNGKNFARRPPVASPDKMMSQTDLTRKLYEQMEKIPYDVSGDAQQQMKTKILVLLALSNLLETQPIYDQLKKIVDFGQLMFWVNQ